MEISTTQLPLHHTPHANSDCGSDDEVNDDEYISLADSEIAPHDQLSCSWEHFVQLDPPSVGVYDYVNGSALWQQPMANKAHNDLIWSYNVVVTHHPGQHLLSFSTPSIQLLHHDCLQWTLPHESHDHDSIRGLTHSTSRDHENTRRPNRNSNRNNRRVTRSMTNNLLSSHLTTSSSSTVPLSSSPSTASDHNRTSQPPKFELRHPDYSVERGSQESEQSSGTSRDPVIVKKYRYVRPYSSNLLLVGEVISKSTRLVDLNDKWLAYAISGVPLFICHDLRIGRRMPRLIVGSLAHIPGSSLSTSGNKQSDPTTNADGHTQVCYHRKVFEANDVIDVIPFDHLNITAEQLLDSKYMTKLANNLIRDRLKLQEQLGMERTRANRQEKRANTLAVTANNEKTRADRQEERANTLAVTANIEKTRANRQEKRAERYRQYMESLGHAPPSSPETDHSSSRHVLS